MKCYKLEDVYGLSRDVPLNYVERSNVDGKLRDNLHRGKHITIFGSSKQGKTCLRKHCLKNDEYIIVQCNNKLSIADLNASILKRAGYEITESTKTSIGGRAKIIASFKAAFASLGSEIEASGNEELTYRPLELDITDTNDIISALNEIGFKKYIVLEDFHYLKTEVQTDFSIQLKAFHENSKLCFIVIGVWLDENKLMVYNGDLTGRVIPVNADLWTKDDLRSVILSGADLLNVCFDEALVEDLIEECYGNVYILQEACYRVCQSAGIQETIKKKTIIGTGIIAREIVKQIIQEQSGRYNTFISQYATGFQETTLEMHKWLLYPILTSSISDLSTGLTYRTIRSVLEKVHPSGKGLNAGNVTQALKAVSSLQQNKSIQPIILDYDESNSKLHVVDKGFLIWLAMQDRNELLAFVELPPMQEELYEQMDLLVGAT